MPRSPDFEKLQTIAAELEQLKASGKWNKSEFDRLLKEADRAAGSSSFGLSEFVVNEGDPSWL